MPPTSTFSCGLVTKILLLAPLASERGRHHEPQDQSEQEHRIPQGAVADPCHAARYTMMSNFGSYLSQASLWFILLGLAVTQLGLPLPETVFIVAAGVVSQRAGLAMGVPILSCCVAVLLGDLSLFYLARHFGPRAFRHRPLRWLLPVAAYPRVDALFARHGSMAIFVARFFSGVRAATFVLAGMRHMPLQRFLLWDGLAILVTVPIFAALGHVFSTRVVALEARVAQANLLLLAVLTLAVVCYVTVVAVRWRRRRAAQTNVDAASNVEP